MLKKFRLESKLVKTPEESPSRPKEPFITQDEVFRGVALVVGTYLLADTFRQVAIYTAMQRIVPKVAE